MQIQEGDYLVEHIGDGKFKVTMYDGRILDAGPNICGMIRYTFFEDYSLPEIGWKITRMELIEKYIPKMQQDVISGKLKPNQMNY